MCALVTVRSAFHGNVEERDGGTGEEKRSRVKIVKGRTEEERVHLPSLLSAECVCALCECVSVL